MYKTTTPLFGINFLASKGGLIRGILRYFEERATILDDWVLHKM